MTTLRARVIQTPEAQHRIVLSPPSAPALKGGGNLNIVCGGCGTVLVENGHHLTLLSTVIRCPRCKQCNELNSI